MPAGRRLPPPSCRLVNSYWSRVPGSGPEQGDRVHSLNAQRPGMLKEDRRDPEKNKKGDALYQVLDQLYSWQDFVQNENLRPTAQKPLRIPETATALH